MNRVDQGPVRFLGFQACAPRLLIVYRVGSDGIGAIPGVAHDRMVLSRAVRKAAREADRS